MPVAPIITPGSSYVSSAVITRSGSLVINRNVSIGSDYYTSPNVVDFGYETLAIPSTALPTIVLNIGIRRYSDSDIPPSGETNTCLPAVMVAPIIADGAVGFGKTLCNPFLVYPMHTATFSIRAPIEKIAFRVGNGIADDLKPILLPAPPDKCWTLVEYTLSASQ